MSRSDESTYVVQVAQDFEVPTGPSEVDVTTVAAWVDVATVTVPLRAKRRRVIAEGLKQAGLSPEIGGEPLRVRVLDVFSAHESPVGAKSREPELTIG